jgi:KDEL-tailed cysteine endopeptidase
MNFSFTILALMMVIANGLNIQDRINIEDRINIVDRFEDWAETHNINIEDDIIYQRIYKNWLNNDKYINYVNFKNLTYTLDHNAYSGYSSEEFKLLMGFNNNNNNKFNQNTNFLRGTNNYLSTLPLEVDWRSKNAVTPIKDQGQCGSCWAFSTVATLESAVAIKTGVLTNLSEQQLVDCDNFKNNGVDHGCNGGLMDNAFGWIGKNNGLCSYDDYQYTSGTTKTAGTCQKTCKNVANTDIYNFIDVESNSDFAMMTALNLQPVAVAIEADQKDFQLYSSGVFTGTCGTTLDHGVVLVGYGSLDGTDYYILRNSWGTSWGVDGYMYLGRGSEYNNGKGQCGVLGEGSYPLV